MRSLDADEGTDDEGLAGSHALNTSVSAKPMNQSEQRISPAL
jgi:hypothetical protein